MRPSLFFILLALLCFQLMLQAQPAIDVPIFVERFSGQPGARWTIATNPETQGLRWYKENERPGFTFLARSLPAYMKTGDYAYAAWPVGTRPFELNWDVTLDQAFSQTWFYPGVAVALSSAPADKMTEKDISVTIAVNFAGVACSVRQGDLYELCKGPYPAPNSSMGDRQLSNTAERRGDIPSISWPDRYVDGTKLSLRITRDENSLLTFTVYNSQLPEGATKPWDVERWQMPQYIAQIPLNYIVIKRIPVLSVHQGYAGFIYRGTVNNIQGRLLSAAAAPHVTGYTPGKPVLNSSVPIILQGEGFTRMTQVRIAGKAGKVHYISPKELRVILPALPVNMRYPCEIRNADGQTTDLSDGLPYGRLLERVEPHEALPVGGDIVTLLGAGFEKNTTVLVGGKQAEIVQLINAGKMKVRVPAGNAGQTAVVLSTGKIPFVGSPNFGYAGHPYLHFNQQDLPALRKKFTDPQFADYHAVILRNGQQGLETKLPITSDFFNSGTALIDELLWAYLLTGDTVYKDKLLLVLTDAVKQRSFADFHLMTVTSMSAAYDALFAELTPEERTMLQDYLDKALSAYLRLAHGGDWFLGAGSNVSNTVAVSNCGGMMVALSLLNSVPEAKEAVDLAARNALRYRDGCLAPDGGCVEGTLYWDYGMTYYLMLGNALRNVTGDDRGLLTNPRVQANPNFLEMILGGDGQMITFNDTQPWLTGMAICAWHDAQSENQLARWMADRMAHELATGGLRVNERPQFFSYAFLWRSEKPAATTFPGIPTVAVLKSMQWGTLRSESAFQPKLVVGVKGSTGQLTHHAQNDLGSFVIQANGEAFVIDPGYYQSEATAHSLPLIDGQGPNITGAAITDSGELGTLRWMTLDATNGYGIATTRVRRTFVLCGNQALVVLDDLLPATNAPGIVTTQIQAGQKTVVETDQRSALITGKNSLLQLHVFGPKIALQANGPRDFAASWVFQEMAKAGQVAWFSITGKYTIDEKTPLITIFTPTLTTQKAPAVDVQYQDDVIRVQAGDQLLKFSKSPSGWSLVKP